MLLFGGWQSGAALADTWLWDGEDWIAVHPATSPPARWGAMACFDASRGTVVMFGGATPSGGRLGDTWEWTGSDWRLLATGGPAARYGGGMAFDSVQGAPILFGGEDRSNRLRDMWRFTGGTWQPMSPPALPPAAVNFVFCADPVRREILFQGGWNHSRIDQCWIWDGTTWTSRPTRGAYADSAAAYDPIRRRIVVFGGNCSADTWEWDGAGWHRRSPGASPEARSHARAAFDPAEGRILLFGGERCIHVAIDDTWEYFLFAPADASAYGQGCQGSHGLVPVLDVVDGSLPWLGEAWHLRASAIPPAPANAVFGLAGRSRSDLPLDGIGMPGCTLLTSGDDHTATLVNRGGHADWTLTLPLDLRLLFTSVYLQVAVFDAQANPLGLIATNGIAGLHGIK